MLTYNPTPVQEINDPLFEKAGVRVLVKREDLNHPTVSGNKWWKLKYNLEEAAMQGKKTFLTFGGAYSNHIYATAAAAHELNFESIGIIRGEETLPLNPTLKFAKEKGMKIHYVSREAYRKKSEPEFIEQLNNQFGDFYLIPEGGTNELAVRGVSEFSQKYLASIDADAVCLAVGTGGTTAGLINELSVDIEIIGFPVLKGGDFLNSEIKKYVVSNFNNWRLECDYHFGGYAKSSSELERFITTSISSYGIPFEFVYTGKAFFGFMELIKKNYFKKGSTLLFLHTGGLQSYS